MEKLHTFLIFFLFTGLCFCQNNYNTQIYRGNQDFKRGDYGSATSRFLDAAKISSKDFTAHYNLGNALYKQKKYDEAKAEFEKASTLAKNKADKAAALHNLGNSLMMKNDHQKAAEAYKQSLKQNPYSEATQKNYAIAKFEEKQQQQQKNQQKQNPGGGKSGDKKDSSEKGNGEKSRQPQQGNGQNGQNGKGNSGQNPNENKNENNGSNMPKNVEKALLNRAGDKERETAKRILNKDAYSTPQSNEKDW